MTKVVDAVGMIVGFLLLAVAVVAGLWGTAHLTGLWFGWALEGFRTVIR